MPPRLSRAPIHAPPDAAHEATTRTRGAPTPLTARVSPRGSPSEGKVKQKKRKPAAQGGARSVKHPSAGARVRGPSKCALLMYAPRPRTNPEGEAEAGAVTEQLQGLHVDTLCLDDAALAAAVVRGCRELSAAL